MDRIKKILRHLRLFLLIILISLGIGLAGAGPVFTNTRERYLDKETRTEMLDKREEESDIDLNEVME